MDYQNKKPGLEANAAVKTTLGMKKTCANVKVYFETVHVCIQLCPPFPPSQFVSVLDF